MKETKIAIYFSIDGTWSKDSNMEHDAVLYIGEDMDEPDFIQHLVNQTIEQNLRKIRDAKFLRQGKTPPVAKMDIPKPAKPKKAEAEPKKKRKSSGRKTRLWVASQNVTKWRLYLNRAIYSNIMDSERNGCSYEWD
jgi:hypothetical protein